MEFSWPPKDADLEGCAIVALEGEHAGRITPLVLDSPDLDVEAADPPPLPVQLAVEPPAVPERPAVAADDASPTREWKYFGRAAFWRVERSDALARFMLEHESRRDDPEAAVAARSAWLALFVAASCLLVTYSEFRADGLRGPSASDMLTTAFAADTDPVPSPDAVPGAAPKFRPPVARPPAARPPAVARPPAARPSAPAAAPTRPLASAPIVRPPAPRREPPRYVAAVATMRVLPTPAPVAVAPPSPPASAVVARATPPPAASTPSPAPTPVAPGLTAAPAPVRPEPIATRVETAAVDREEDDIRSTLTRFRTAYSQLNATAAQEVWPSVDVRALRSAFRGLKSQELHFDRCQLTVAGSRARAACTGRAVYVPGVGDQSPRTSPRAWNFELTKARERWTIASARSS